MRLLLTTARARARGATDAASFLSITTQPSGAVDGVAFTTQPVLQLRDGNGNAVAQSGVTVTASKATGSGTLGGTLTANTNASGVATFTNLAITGTGDHALQFAASGYTSVVSGTVSVAAGDGAGVFTAMGVEPVFRSGTDTMLWEDPRTRMTPEPTESYASVLAMQTQASECGTPPPDSDSTYGRRTLANANNACIPDSGAYLDTLVIPDGVGTRQAMGATWAGGPETGVDWWTPHRYSGSPSGMSYDSALEVVAEMWFQFVSGTIGTNGAKWLMAWGPTATRLQFTTNASSWGFGPWGYASGDDGAGMTARTPFSETGEIGHQTYAADQSLHKMTLCQYRGSPPYIAGYLDGVLICIVKESHAGVTPAGGHKHWCTSTEVTDTVALMENWVDFFFPGTVNATSVAADIKFLPVRCWTRPTPHL